MTSLKEAIKFPLIKFGILSLIFALVLSLLAMHGVEKSYENSGVLGVGEHVIGDEEFEKRYYITNRTLTLFSENASFCVIQANSIKYYFLHNESLNLTPISRPTIHIQKGNLTYSYKVNGVNYPFSSLSILAFILMIVGTVLSMAGYVRFMEKHLKR